MQSRDRYKGDIPTMELPVHTPGFRPGAYKASSEVAEVLRRIDLSILTVSEARNLPDAGKQLAHEMKKILGLAPEADNRIGQRIKDLKGKPICAETIRESLVSAIEYVSSAKFTDPESGELTRLRAVMLYCGVPVCRRFIFTNAPLSAISELETELVSCITNIRSIRLDKEPGSLRFLFMTYKDAEKPLFNLCKSHPATDSAVAAAESMRESAPSIDLPAPSQRQHMDKYGHRIIRPVQDEEPPSKFYEYLSSCRPSNNLLGLGPEHFMHARVVKDPELVRRFKDAKCRVGGVETTLLSRLAEVVVGDKRYLVSKGIHPAKIADGSMDASGELSLIDASKYACFVRPDAPQKVSEENCVYIILMARAEGSSFSITPSRVSILEDPPSQAPRLSAADELVLFAHNSVRDFARGFGASWTPEDEYAGNNGDIALLAVRGGENHIITNMHFTEACEKLEACLSTLSTKVLLTPEVLHVRSQEVSLPNGGRMRVTIIPCGKAERQINEDTPLPTPLVIPVAASHRQETGKSAQQAAVPQDMGLPATREGVVELMRGALIYAPVSAFLDPSEERLFEIRQKFFSSFSQRIIQASARNEGGRATACTQISTSGNFWFHLFRLNCSPDLLPAGLLRVRNAIIFSKNGAGFILIENSSITPEVRHLLLEHTTLR